MNIDFNFINNQAVQIQEEVYNICKNHIECNDCPLKTQDLNIDGSVIRCENKNKENK